VGANDEVRQDRFARSAGDLRYSAGAWAAGKLAGRGIASMITIDGGACRRASNYENRGAISATTTALIISAPRPDADSR
jgi:hypothetical protein